MFILPFNLIERCLICIPRFSKETPHSSLITDITPDPRHNKNSSKSLICSFYAWSPLATIDLTCFHHITTLSHRDQIQPSVPTHLVRKQAESSYVSCSKSQSKQPLWKSNTTTCIRQGLENFSVSRARKYFRLHGPCSLFQWHCSVTAVGKPPQLVLTVGTFCPVDLRSASPALHHTSSSLHQEVVMLECKTVTTWTHTAW